jgi:diacylglycerol O-acyltransferase / wax synthase
MSERFERFMGDSDGVMWTIEQDPVLRSTIVAVTLLERAPEWDRFLATIERATRRIPRLRQRVLETPFRIAPPRWVVDDDFDVERHVERVVVTGRGDLDAVWDIAAEIGIHNFNRSRPLWEVALVEGLDDGRAAVIQKIHHSLTDGIGAMRLALMLYDLDPDGRTVEPAVDAPLPEVLTWPALFADATLFTFGRTLRGATGFARECVQQLPRAARSPRRTFGNAVDLMRSTVRLLAPVNETLSPIMRSRTTSWRYHAFEVPLDDMRAAAVAADGTINDVFIAGLAEGFRRYHRVHGASVAELRMTMPISYRSDDDPLGGNRFVPARLTVPIDIDDRVKRVQAVGARCHAYQHEPALPLTDAISTVLDHLPAWFTTRFLGGMLKHVDFVATNIPGLQQTVYLAGARVDRMYAFAPLAGAAVNIALVSHCGCCCIGVTTDIAAVPDAPVLVDCFREAFADVLTAGAMEAQAEVMR